MWHRVLTLVIKELQVLLRDRQGRVLLVMPVLIQTAIFPFAATLEVRNNTLAILNEDNAAASFELIQRLSQAKAFSEVLSLRGESHLRRVLDEQQALLVLRFPPDFSRALAQGGSPTLQALLDGRRSNSGQIALGYVRDILQSYLRERQAGARSAPASELLVTHWFNPNLDYVRHVIPSLVALITTITTMIVSALSVAREREQGTFDQLRVSPLTPGMLIAGKTIPALLVGVFQGTIVLAAGVFVYRIPFQGSLPLLYASMLCYILALVGFGLLISSICSTQQQAFLGVFSFVMPAILLSGFPAPIENMPLWLQRVDWFNPLTHFIVIVKGLFLKNVDVDILWQSVWPLLVIAAITLSAANLMFRRKLG